MSTEWSQRIEEVYRSALKLAPDQRAAFVSEMCGNNHDLRRSVETLLRHGNPPDVFGPKPIWESTRGSLSTCAPIPASDLIGHQISHYEVLQKLGEGGMGVVYRARDLRLGRSVALKVLPPEKLANPDRKWRFVQEARAASALNHPHIITIHEIDQSDGVDFIAMEYVEGKTLADLIGRKGVKLVDALKYAVQIADALAMAHAVGIVHRDLKPGNVMVTSDGRVKVLDFGLAKLTEPAAVIDEGTTLTEPQSTESGIIVGTLSYMSPEQAQGQKVDARSDIFSLGSVLYEMLTGQRLFRRDNPVLTLAAILHEEPPPLPAEFSRDLVTVVTRCLRKDVARRFQHMDDVTIALTELKEDSESGKLVAPAHVLPGPRTGRRILAAGAITTVLLCIGGWYLARNGTDFSALLRPSAPASNYSMRLTITLPPEAPLASPGNASPAHDRPVLALSPDGTLLAYVAEIGTKTQIHLRDMTSGKVTALPETDRGHTPFFSPDGASIGFFADGKLKRTSFSGGTALVLADAPNPWGAVWGNDNAIYFNRFEGEGIYRVAADGGPVRAVSTGQQFMPHLLGPGQRLLATSRGGVFSDIERTPRFVIAGVSPRYVPTGHLVYAISGRLMAVPYDPARSEVTGPSVSLFEDLRTAPYGVAQFTLAENGTLVYASGRPQMLTSFTWVDRKGKSRPAGLPEDTYSAFDLSPDGKRLAYTKDAPEGESSIWVYDFSRGATSRLTPRASAGGPAANLWPRWTPDSLHVVYARLQQSQWQLFRAPVDGSGDAVELWSHKAGGPAWLYPMSFSPDGSVMAVFGPGPKPSFDVFLMPSQRLDRSTAKTEPVLFLGNSFGECFGQLSPDGHWMLFSSDQSGSFESYMTSYPKPGAIHQISRNGGAEPVWNPSAPEILYRSGREMYSVEVTFSPEFRAAQPRLLYEGPYPDVPGLGFDITSDGQQFLRLENKDFLKPATTLTVITNFPEQLRRRVPSQREKQ